jgi:hypothetical protein
MRKFLFAAAIAVVSLFSAARSAEATFQMRIESGTTTGPGVVITDESASESGVTAGAFAGTPNAISFSGSIGQFTLNVTTGTSTPFLSAPSFYEAQDLTNVTINSSGAGTLRLILSKDNYGAGTPDGNLTFKSDVGGVLTAGAGSSITFASYVDDGNGIPNLGHDQNPVGALDPVTGVGTAAITQTFGPGVFSDSTGVAFSKTGTYSIYQVVTVTFTGAGSVSFNDTVGTAPAPAGLVLALTGLPALGVGNWLRRRRNRTGA